MYLIRRDLIQRDLIRCDLIRLDLVRRGGLLLWRGSGRVYVWVFGGGGRYGGRVCEKRNSCWAVFLFNGGRARFSD